MTVRMNVKPTVKQTETITAALPAFEKGTSRYNRKKEDIL